MPPKIARLAGLGAFAVCGGLIAVFALFAYYIRATQYSGLDSTLRFLASLGVGGVLVALLGVHYIFGKRLMALARGEMQRA